MAGFFTPASKKEPEKITWLVVKGTLLVARSALQSEKETEARSPRLIAAFDLVHDLVQGCSLGQTTGLIRVRTLRSSRPNKAADFPRTRPTGNGGILSSQAP